MKHDIQAISIQYAFLLQYKLNFLHHSAHCFMFCDTTEVSEVSSKGEVLNYGKHTHMRAK